VEISVFFTSGPRAGFNLSKLRGRFCINYFSLEFMIGLLQAVVFTVLSALYFKEANAFVLSR